jgi:hypothetical protein
MPTLLLPLLKPCKNPPHNKAAWLPITIQCKATDLFLCHLLPVGQWQSLPAVWSYRNILNEKTEAPVLKPPQSLHPKCSYG